jgi:hypothetical protein
MKSKIIYLLKILPKKKIKKMSEILIFCFIIVIMNTFLVYAQCPPSLDNWQHMRSVFEPYPAQVMGYVDIKYQDLGNGVYDIKVDWSTFFNGLQRIGITDEEFKQMMIKAIMVDLMKSEFCNIQQPPTHFRFYEETECKVTKRCWVKCDAQYNFACADPEWGPIEPSAQNFNAGWVYPIETTSICGNQCCITDYSVDCITDPDSGWSVPHIINIAKTTSGTSCSSLAPDCHPWYPPINCESDCK